MGIHDDDVPALTTLISAERLGSLVQLTGNTKAALELHQETLAVGAALMNVIASIEIAVRNALCENLAQHFGTADWLTSPPTPFFWKQPEAENIRKALDSARRAEYAKLSQAQKRALDAHNGPPAHLSHLSHLARAKARRGHITVTTGKVIAELTFYIWKRICGPDYEHALWRPTLRKTFPNKSIKRATVADHLETIYQARNRIAHHEPVLRKRFYDTVDSITFISESLGVPSPGPDSPLAHLIAEDKANAEAKAAAHHARLDTYRLRP